MALTPDDIEKRQFGTSRKGYSPDEVKRFLAEVAAAQRQAEATPAFARLGGEVASVLESAHRSAESITTSAQTDAEQTRAEADAYAIETRAKAERDAADHFAAAEKARVDAEAAAAELRDTAERQAANDRSVAERARAEAEAFAASETERMTQAKNESDEQIAAALAALESETSAQRDEAATRAAQLVADAETQASSVVADAQAHAEQVTSAAEAQAAALLDDAETRAQAQLGQAEDEARRRSTTVIAQAQGRLDKLLGAERDVHDRLVAASADIRVAIGRVAGRQAAELELTTEDPTIDIDRAAPWNDAPAHPGQLEAVPSEPVVDAGSEAAEMTPETPADDAPGATVIDLDTPGADEPGRGPSSRAGSAQGDALSRMVNEAVGNALKGLKP